MSQQPVWKLVYSTDYSALFVDETGVYDPELMIAQEYETERGKTKFQVYRFSLDRQKIVRKDGKSYLVPFGYDGSYPHPVHRYQEWFVKDLASIARSSGSSYKTLVKALVSSDPSQRAEAYEAIGGYHGFDNFDQYPETWSESEMEKNWP
jgi:hypothetical protein